MKSTLMHRMPAIGLSSYVASAQSCTAPDAAVQGTGLPFAGTSVPTVAAAVAGVRSTDLPGSPPRGAPV